MTPKDKEDSGRQILEKIWRFITKKGHYCDTEYNNTLIHEHLWNLLKKPPGQDPVGKETAQG